jgi:putative DNA primase/helicase
LSKQETINKHLSFKDIDQLIDQTSSFKDLTGYVWKAFLANKKHLKGSEIKRLSKKIANKAGISDAQNCLRDSDEFRLT